MNGLNDKGKALAAVTMNLTGGQRPLFDFAFWNYTKSPSSFLFNRIPINPTYEQAVGNVVDNTDSVYQLDNDPAVSADEQQLKDSVMQIAADPQARHQNGLAAIPKVTGNLRVPTVSLHTIGDLYVPFSMEQIYAKRAAEHGKQDLLVSRAIRDVGHCGFTVSEQSDAFDALVNWVENGIKPAGDDILNPSVVADRHFGMKFTSNLRSYDPEAAPHAH